MPAEKKFACPACYLLLPHRFFRGDTLRKWPFLLSCLLAAALLWQPQTAAKAVQDGLQICFSSLFPSLFPFLAVSGLLIRLGFADFTGRIFGRFFCPLLRLSPAGLSALLLGLTGGYPTGARAVLQLHEQGLCSPEECRHLLAFCNNAGPAFLLSVAGLGIFGSLRVGAILYMIHVLSALLTALIFRPRHPFPQKHSPKPEIQSFPSAFTDSVLSAFSSMLNICAFVLLFLVLLRLLSASGILSLLGRIDPLLPKICTGLLELTNGIQNLSAAPSGFILAAFFTGWGGFSVHCQTAALLQGSGLSLRRYLPGKAVQAVLSAFLAALVFPFAV